MKKLKNWTGKEVEIEVKGKHIYRGFIWRYYRTSLCRDNDYEYYIGYDGGMMIQIKPSEVINIKEV